MSWKLSSAITVTAEVQQAMEMRLHSKTLPPMQPRSSNLWLLHWLKTFLKGTKFEMIAGIKEKRYSVLPFEKTLMRKKW